MDLTTSFDPSLAMKISFGAKINWFKSNGRVGTLVRVSIAIFAGIVAFE